MKPNFLTPQDPHQKPASGKVDAVIILGIVFAAILSFVLYQHFEAKYNQEVFRPGRCTRCFKDWDNCRAHVTKFYPPEWNLAIAPLCEICWSVKTPKDRLEYYRQAFEWEVRNGIKDKSAWPALRDAVLDGK